MLTLKEDHCFLCNKLKTDSETLVITEGYSTYVEFHKACWKASSGSVNKKKEYTNEGWLAKVGQAYSVEFTKVIWSDGTEDWFKKGKRHRLNGSAIVRPDGLEMWYIEGKLHRLDGPAIICADRSKCWYIEGQRFDTEDQFNARIKEMKAS